MWNSFTSAFRIVLAALLLAMLLPVGAVADRLNLLGDLEFATSDNESTNKQTGDVTNSQTDRYSQLYTLDLDKTLTPYLIFNAGGTFELNESDNDTDGVERTTRDRQIRPHVGLELNNPLLRSSVDYRKTELKNSGTDIAETKNYTEEYTGNLSWRPSDLPRVNMEFARTLAYDEPQTRDSVNDAFTLSSNYDYKQFRFDYTHTRNDNRDKLEDFETQTRNNSGGILYADGFMDDTLSVNAGAKIDRSTAEFTGSGERLLQTSPVGAGFFLLSDPFPEDNLPGEFTDVSSTNPFSTVNIGLGGGSGQVSFGLFFSNAVEVDVIRLPLFSDPEDPTIATPGQIASVANLFDWSLFVSDDQLSWTEVPIASVEYDLFDNRFEIRPQQTLTEDYFKVVTRPLNVVAPGKILLNDVQAFTILPQDEAPKLTSTTQIYNFGLNYILSSKTSVGYDTYFQHQNTEPFGAERIRWTNGLSLQHRFNRIFSNASRFLRSESWEDGSKESTNHNFSTSLRAIYLPTFDQTLTYSLTQTSERAGDSTTNAVVLRSNLDVYEGFTLSLDQGYSWQNPLEGGDTSSFLLRGRSNIVPHRRLDLNLDYSVTWNYEEGEPDGRTESGRFSGFWLPLDTLSLSADINVRRTETNGDIDSRVLRDYSVSWSPLLHGTLQFSVVYTESSSTENEESYTLSENLRWRMTNYALLTLSHSQGTNETELEKTENQAIFANLRIYY